MLQRKGTQPHDGWWGLRACEREIVTRVIEGGPWERDGEQKDPGEQAGLPGSIAFCGTNSITSISTTSSSRDRTPSTETVRPTGRRKEGRADPIR